MKSLVEEANIRFHISLTPIQEQQLVSYESVLQTWNEKINLTALTTHEDIQKKHFLDSLACALSWTHHGAPRSLIDVGTGAGFPGIVLKIAFPQIHVVLLESIHKKADFCQYVIETLRLEDIQIISERAELIGHEKEYREQYGVAAARAVAPLSLLSEYLLPFVEIGGYMLAMKGPDPAEELSNAQQNITVLGGQEPERISYILPDDNTPRSLIISKKISHTPSIYPRISIPSKK